MKKLTLFFAMLGLMAVSCMKEMEDMEPAQTSGEYIIRLDGAAAPATRLDLLGNGGDDGYILNWSSADKIVLHSASIAGVTAEVDKDDFAAQQELKDLSRVRFNSTSAVTVKGSEELVILYPHTMTYSGGKATGTISATQLQSIANGQDPISRPRGSAYHLGANSVAYGKTTIDANLAVNGVIPVAFTVAQKASFVKITLKGTSEYAGYELVGAKLYAKGEKLAGTVTYNPANGSVSVADNGASDVVGVEYKVPQAVVENGEYNLYLAAAPRAAGASGELTVIVTLRKGYQTVTLPHKLPAGFKIESGKVSAIKLPISKQINSYEWFEPEDVRDMVGGWAYGAQNTYTVEKNGTVSFEVKARGDFLKVKEPKTYDVILEGFPLGYRTGIVGSGNVGADMKISVKGGGATPGGLVGIRDASGNLLWSFIIWKYNTGDAPKDFQYASGTVMMDRVLGQAEGLKAARTAGKFDGNVFYFQWGRKDPVLWSNTNYESIWKLASAAGVDLATTIANPTVMYVHGPSYNWTDGALNTGLWGGVPKQGSSNFDKTSTGHKTIYDPCPEGYRVPDPKVFAEVTATAEIREKKLNSSNKIWKTGETANSAQYAGWIQETGFESHAIVAHHIGSTVDCWPYFGWKNYSTLASLDYLSRPATGGVTGAVYWSNGTNAGGTRGASMEYAYYGSGSTSSKNHNIRYDLAPSIAAPVRCQKETDTPANANPAITLPAYKEPAAAQKKYVCLSFDDGPHYTTGATAPYDPAKSTSMAVMDVLETYGVPASFFVIGKNIDKNKENAKKVMKRGISLGCDYQNHSYSHVRMGKGSDPAMTAAEMKEEISSTSALIKEITGVEPKFFRPPFIDLNDLMYETIGLHFIKGISTRDSDKTVTTQERIDAVLNNVKNGDVILMHDFGGNTMTVEAIKTIIPTLIGRGYTFVTVTDLFKLRSNGMPALHNKVLYSNAFDQ